MRTPLRAQSCRRDQKFDRFQGMRDRWVTSVSIIARISGYRLNDRRQFSISKMSDWVRSLPGSKSEGPGDWLSWVKISWFLSVFPGKSMPVPSVILPVHLSLTTLLFDEACSLLLRASLNIHKYTWTDRDRCPASYTFYGVAQRLLASG
jgi:hypothetical protein